MSQFISNLSFHSQSAIKSLLKNHEVNDRVCELQDAFQSSNSKNDSLTQDFISFLHRLGVPPVGNVPPTELPSPDEVFDKLLHSRGAVGAHPNGISNLASAFLNIASLSLRPANTISSSGTKSPCFDLSPLYGHQPSDTDKVRMKEGYGMLSPDCISDDRLILFPNATTVLLLLFNRNHNYIARRLFLQNEEATNVFKDDSHRIEQDDDIFKKARLINCGHFRNIMLEDVLKPVAGLPVVGLSHGIDFLSEPKGTTQTPVGEVIKDNYVEAALLYDPSDIMSEKDALEVKDAMESFLYEKSDLHLDKISLADFDRALSEHLLSVNPNRRTRNYAGLQRGNDSYFDDLDLARILHEATEWPARSTGAGFLSDQRVQQVQTIEWARELKACSFVDYRRSLGLKVPHSFDEWTSDKLVAKAAETLYRNIENLELYVGLQLEDTVPESKDSGLRFGYTKTYGLLVDIVSRIRNDPALTRDFTPSNVTAWGFQDCIPKRENGSFGASLPRLLQRTLPRQYAYNNIYGLFPFNTPAHATKCLKNHLQTSQVPDTLSKYDIEKPKLRKVQHLVTKEEISRVFNDPIAFPNPYAERLAALTRGYGYFLGFDDEIKHDRDRMMTLHSLIPDSRALKRYAESFSMMANELIREKTTERGELDVARDVINAVCIRWVSETLLEYPLKISRNTDETTIPDSNTEQPDTFQRYVRDPIWRWLTTFEVVRKIKLALKEGIQPGQNGELRVEDLSDKFASIYAFVFQNFNQEDAWVLRETALLTSEALCSHISRKIPAAGSISDQSFFGFLKDTGKQTNLFILHILQEFTSGIAMQEQSAQTFLSTVANANKSIPPSEGTDDTQARVVANVLGSAVIASVKYAKVCTQAVNFYLQEEYAEERKKIVELCQKDDIASKRLLMGYIREAYRLDHPLGLWRRTKEPSETGVTTHGANGHAVSGIEQGDLIFADFDQALRSPDKVDPTREKNPALQGFGLHRCPGFTFVDETMPEIFKAIFKLENLRRSKDSRGRLLRFNAHPQLHDVSATLFINPELTNATTNSNGSAGYKLGPYPQSLVLEYDVKNTPATAANGKAVETKTVAQKRMKWKIIHGEGTQKMRARMDGIILVILILLLSSTIFSTIRSIISLFSGSSKPSPSRTPTAPPPPPPATSIAGCPLPTSVINPWETITMHVGEDGKLVPIEYTVDLPTSHRLSFVDVDEKDMRMKLVFDNSVLGLTPDVELDKSDSCGDNFAECLDKHFSGGDIVLPNGKHTVRIEWAGVETPGPDGKIDWGEMKGRRIGWSRVQCGA